MAVAIAFLYVFFSFAVYMFHDLRTRGPHTVSAAPTVDAQRTTESTSKAAEDTETMVDRWWNEKWRMS
jgi:hypothetical protein